MAGTFQWGTALGASVALFVAAGAFHFLIGLLTPIMLRRGPRTAILVASERSDSAAFGRDTAAWLAESPGLGAYRLVVWHLLAALLLGLGTLEAAVAWFGLRSGHEWALPVLTVEGALLLAVWPLAFAPYVRARAPLGVADVPPFVWVPSVLFLAAATLGWIAHASAP